jgi:hypothetical protein
MTRQTIYVPPGVVMYRVVLEHFIADSYTRRFSSSVQYTDYIEPESDVTVSQDLMITY